MNETKTLIRSMIHSGFQLLVIALIIGIVIGSISLVITYFDNIVQGLNFINSILLPIKHFMQDHIWYFIVGWFFYIIWWCFVWNKIPSHHINSYIVLRNIIFPPSLMGLIIMLGIADMLDGGYSASFYVLSIIYIIVFFGILDEINRYIANKKHKAIKETE